MLYVAYPLCGTQRPAVISRGETTRNLNDSSLLKQGRLTMDAILQATADPTKALFYLSGPVEMINTFQNGLKDTGINETSIRIDEWE